MASSAPTTDPIRELDELIARLHLPDLRRQVAAAESFDPGPPQVAMESLGEQAPIRRGFDERKPSSRVLPDFAHDRANGDYYPIFQNEFDLAAIRGVARFLSESAYGQGILGSRRNYVVHTGFDYAATAKRGANAPEKLVVEVQRIIDEFLSANRWELDWEHELFDATETDGEVIVALETDGDQVRARRAEPSWLTQPADTTHLERRINATGHLDWKYGIATEPTDATKIHGYFIQWNGDPTAWNFYAPSRMLHLKSNTPRHVKRGLSSFYPVDGQLTGATELLRRMTSGAGIQASIALIVEAAAGSGSMGIGDSSPIGRLANAGGSALRSGGAYGRERYSDWGEGTVIDTKNKKFQAGPMAGTQAANYIQVLQAGLRAAGTRWNMPEYMVSGDASNNNYASILESGSPFVRGVESDQEKRVKAFERLLWSVIRIALENGRLNLRKYGMTWLDLRAVINVIVSGTSPAVRDRVTDFAVDTVLNDKGMVSDESLATKYDWDWEEEKEKGAKAREQGQLGEGEPKNKRGDGIPGINLPTQFAAKESIEKIQEDCGTGSGGFKPGNSCAKGGGQGKSKSSGGSKKGESKPIDNANVSEKSRIARENHKRVGEEIQRYAEEHNESVLAKTLGGKKFDNSEPVDVMTDLGGIELKTMVDNKNGKITMKRSAMEKKAAWERQNKTDMHTVVFDDSGVFNAKGPGKHDESKRRIFYRRGYGSFRVNSMLEISGLDELKSMMAMDSRRLPPAARRPQGQKRGRLVS